MTTDVRDPAPAHPAPRLFALAAALSIGILVAEALHPPPPAAVLAGVLAAALLIGRAHARRRTVAALLAAALLGLSLCGLRVASLDRAALAAGARHGADALLDGRLLGDPDELGGTSRVLLGVASAEVDGRPVRVRERVLLVIRPVARRLAAGDRVRVDVRLSALLRDGANADRAARASAARLYHQGVSARAYARAGAVQRLGPARDPLSRVARAGRHAVNRVATHLPEKEAGLLLGVTIGDTSRLDPTLEEDFRDTGLSHLTAVSGANLAMFLGAIGVLIRLARLRRRATLAILFIALLAFMAITRFEPSVLRAGAMAAVGLGGLAAGATREALTALAVGCIGLLCWDPFLVHVPGFQLSALATVGILVLAPRLARAAGGGKLGAAAAVTLGAQLAVAPLIALTFHRFSVVALPANLLALPGVAPATVLGFAAAAAGAVWEPIGVAIATVARPSLAWMSAVAGAFARVPAASVELPGGPAGVAALLLVAAMPVLALRARMPRRGAPIILAVALLATTTAWARALGPPPLDGLVITALDVGQGDAWLVRTPRGATMLVDGGADERLVLTKLRDRGVRRIDLIVLTHPHADHVDGLPSAVERYASGRALEPGLEAPLPALKRFRDATATNGIPLEVVRRGARYALGEAVVEVIGPADILEGTDSDLNNNSVVLRVRFGASCVLMSGEVQEDGQQALLDHKDPLHCPIMTVPHHGSKRMLPEYFRAVAPAIAMISVGVRNDFGHPAAETLVALQQLGVRVLRTDLSGDISAGLRADGSVDVRTEHAERPAA